MLLQSILTDAQLTLSRNGIDNATQEAGWLVSQLLGDNPIHVPRQLDRDFPDDKVAILQERLLRRIHGEPLQYIMGDVDFHCVNLLVGPGVLIPRPETEQLVEIALKHLAIDGPVLDLCTGSGAIALALAAARPSRLIDATELSAAALSWASRNCRHVSVTNVHLYEGDLFDPLPQNRRYALITANPPYVSADEYDALEPVVRNHEPKMALVADDNGLAVLRRIAEGALTRLLPDGWLLCEIGENQGAAMHDILTGLHYSIVSIQKDYAERDRFALAKR